MSELLDQLCGSSAQIPNAAVAVDTVTTAKRGVGSASVHRMVGTLDFLSFPSCVPIAACAILLGTACVATGWWRVLPANLPGDEWFNAERVAGLSLRALVGWTQPPDAPQRPWLAASGIGIALGGIAILLAGSVLGLLRPVIDRALARWARDVRLVVFDDAAGAAVAAEPTAWTNVFLGEGSLVDSNVRALHARLDDEFLADSLPALAPNIRELYALGTDATSNIELARRLGGLRRTRPAALPLDRLYVRIDPRELRRSIGRDSEFADAASDARLVSLPEARCRCLLRDQPPSKVRVANRDGRAALVIIGLGETGLELLVQLCAQAQSPANDPLVIVVTDTEAPAAARELLELWPGLTIVVELIPLALEPRLPQSAASLIRHLHNERLIPSCLYIALDDAALSAAWEHELSLAVRLAGQAPPLVLPVGKDAQNDGLLLAEEEVSDLLQRRLHADYLERSIGAAAPGAAALGAAALGAAALGAPAPRPAATGSSAVDWSRLPFDYQEENRSVADHLWTKARDRNLRIVPGVDAGALPLDATAFEALSAAEHRRWVASRAVAGWRFGETRSESEYTHPSMVPWSRLSESEREKDRSVIRTMPAVLAGVGLSLQPLVNVAVARTGVTESSADVLIERARSVARAEAGAGAAPNLLIAVEDVRGFRLARRLTESPDIAISLVLAQPMSGLAVSAGLPSLEASNLARAAQMLWITRPDELESVLTRWPRLADC